MDSRTRQEPFLCHYVDKDVQRMFLPLNLMQALSLNPKYQIRNNFVNSNNPLSNFMSFCGLLTFLSLSLGRICAMVFDDNKQRYKNVNFLRFATVFDAVFYASGYVMNFVLTVVHSKYNVQFILVFQNVHKFIHDFASTKRMIIRNWCFVFALLLFQITACTYVYVVYMHPPWYVILYVLVLLTGDCNAVYAICLIKLLTEKLEQWNEKLLLLLSNGRRELGYDKMTSAYVHLLECYNVYKKLFQLPILFHIVETFFLGLVKVQILIDFLHYFSKNPENGISVVQGLLYVFMVKCMLIQIILCNYTQAFYDTMEISQDLCILVLASNCTTEEKRYCKNIRRLHRASYSKMRACGLFCIDISQPLSGLALLTNYTVVLLQFALL